MMDGRIGSLVVAAQDDPFPEVRTLPPFQSPPGLPPDGTTLAITYYGAVAKHGHRSLSPT